MEEQTKIRRRPDKRWLWILAGAAAVLLAVVVFTVRIHREQKPEAEVITVSTLEKIIHVSELSTFTAVYNGIAEVKNEKKPEQIDYYVSYAARVNAGIDFQRKKRFQPLPDRIASGIVPRERHDLDLRPPVRQRFAGKIDRLRHRKQRIAEL